MMIGNLESCDSFADRMCDLIERRAPFFMRVGGGSLMQEYDDRRGPHPHRITPQQKAKALELAATGKFTGTEIAQQVGSTQSRVFKLCRKAGIKLPDGRSAPRGK